MSFEFIIPKNALSFLALLLAPLTGFCQITAKLTYQNGTEQSFAINANGKLYFDNSNLLLQADIGTTPSTIPLSIISRLQFLSASQPVSITLKSFNAQLKGCKVFFDWKMADANNIQQFQLQSSVDGVLFETVASINANSSFDTYSHQMEQRITKAYYRLLIQDYDAALTYSKTVAVVSNCNNVDVSLAPNPIVAGNSFTVNVSGLMESNAQLFSMTGKLIGVFKLQNGSNVIAIPNLLPGVYLLNVSDKSDKYITTKRIVVL